MQVSQSYIMNYTIILRTNIYHYSVTMKLTINVLPKLKSFPYKRAS